MDGSADGKDESSIKPVSSLRSRFENLQKDSSTPPATPISGRSPFLPGGAVPPTNVRPNASAGEELAQGHNRANQDVLPAPVPRRRWPSPPKSRPQSMISNTPSRMSPPLVTVDSPHSPGKRSLDLRRPLHSFAPAEANSYSPVKPYPQIPSRSTTPALEARMVALLNAHEAFKPASEGANAESPSPEVNGNSPATSIPPPVNRAGKPQIPVKPANLTMKSEALAAPEPSMGPADKKISPFNTPPSSGANSPRKFSLSSRTRNESDASVVEGMRSNSDASFVERIRTDSTSSAGQHIPADPNTSASARARATSNASFVEDSGLPDNWHNFSPPSLHQVAARRDQPPNGVQRAARYQPSAAQDRTGAGDSSDLPEEKPRLPARPELQMRSGRNSPPKPQPGRTSPIKRFLPERPNDILKRAQTVDGNHTPRVPATKPTPRSALTMGFDRSASSMTASIDRIAPPVPQPRRSMDRRRDPPAEPTREPTRVEGQSHDDEEDAPQQFDTSSAQPTAASDYPDASQANRHPPKFKQRPWQIPTEYDTRTFAVCGEYVCTTGHRTKAWSLRTGEQLMDMEHHEIMKVSSLVFKPSAAVEDEGNRVWLGTSNGEIHEVDIPNGAVVKTKSGAHARKDIIRMFRYASELWTLDDGGDLNVWKPDHRGMPSLDSQFMTFRTPRGHTFSMALGSHLWIATGKDIRVFAPSARSEVDFQVLLNPLSQPGTGEVHSGATLSIKPELVYFGHQDGKVSIYNRHDFSCTAVVNVSMYKLSSLAGAGEYLWAGFSTGMVYIYDTSTTPWRVKKDWPAHESKVCGINADRSAPWKMDRLQVVTLGTDNMLRIWDGMLEEDWIESRMQEHDSEYCSFHEISTAVLTWNAGASKPSYLQHDLRDDNFFREYMTAHEATDIFVFGFQELVDLEDKKVTAKSFFKSKKKDANEQEHMSHQYRAWRDHLTRCLDEYMPASTSYVLLHTASLGAEVKRGMGGMYGNKGALVLRMVLDDSSLCFVNCHLAAGQTETLHRNNDIAAILEAEALPAYPLNNDTMAEHADVFTSGGDGSLILDHEICVLNGDLNYRIDTMGRDTVIKQINNNNLGKLLERDQLLLSRRKNPGFRLRTFQESEITFAPTYKYNPRSDEYDTSEKRRAPAWCDRILYRGLGKVKMEEYRRWEVRVSDHRPVSGKLRMRVKAVDAEKREKVREVCQGELEGMQRRVARSAQLEYLTMVLGLTQKEAASALKAL